MRIFENIDCMLGLEKYKDVLKSRKVLAICDPEYGLGIDGQKEQKNNKNPKHNRKHHEKKEWDSNGIPSSDYFNALFNYSENQIIWGGNYFVKYFNEGHKGWVVWDKGQRGLTMSDCELAYSSFDYATRIYTLNRVELLIEGTIHPTQKPVKLYKWLLENYSKGHDLILDTHVGSASSLIACEEFGIDYIGFELDKDYYNSATARLEKARYERESQKAKVCVTDGLALFNQGE